MSPRSMQTNCAESGTAPRSSKLRSFRKPSNGAGFRAFSNCADPFLRGRPRSLQVIDSKGKNELRNCAPLKGEKKAAQNGFSSPFRLVLAKPTAGMTPSPHGEPSMTFALFRAVEACRALLAEAHPLARASTVSALEFGVSPDEVARLALEAHQACSAARARRDNQTARPMVACRAIPEPAADGEPKQ